MKIVVNHVTRMGYGHICVAGIDLSTARHIRPVHAREQLTVRYLRQNGGPFEVGCVAELGPVKPIGQPPEMEDVRFNPLRASFLFQPHPADFWQLLLDVSHADLGSIFGTHLKQDGRSCTVDVGKGTASLGCLQLTTKPFLHLDSRGRVRMDLCDGGLNGNFSVTDVRFCEQDHKTPRRQVVAAVAARISKGEGVILGVGLTRPWHKDGDTAPKHWLQVNNVHLEGDPVWMDAPRQA